MCQQITKQQESREKSANRATAIPKTVKDWRKPIVQTTLKKVGSDDTITRIQKNKAVGKAKSDFVTETFTQKTKMRGN